MLLRPFQRILLLALWLPLWLAETRAETTLQYRFGGLSLSIPDGNPSGCFEVRTVDSGLVGAAILKVRVLLEIGGPSPLNGDLYVALRHGNHAAVLLNRVGRRAAALGGYGDAGMNIVLDDDAVEGNVHDYRLALFGNEDQTLLGDPLAGEWMSDGRNVDPSVVLDDSERTASLSSFNGLSPDGVWRLVLVDLSPGGQSRLKSWGLDITVSQAPSPDLTFTEATLRADGSDRLLGGSATLTGQNVFEAVSSFAVSAPLSGSGSLTKIGPGPLTLSEANGYEGGTVVKAGTLFLDNLSGSGSGSGPVDVQASGTLGGSGSVSGSVTLDGLLSPGQGVGSFSSGPQTWNPGARLLWEIGSSSGLPGVDWDWVGVEGSLTVNATAASKFVFDIASLGLASFDAGHDHVWTVLATAAGIVGFDPAAIELRHSAFLPSLESGTFSLALANGAKELQLRFTAAVVAPNTPPIAADDSAATTLNKSLSIDAAKLLANDSDADGDTLSVSAVDAASALGGSVSLAGGKVVYTPLLNSTGTDSFRYTVSDGRGGAAQASVTVIVRAASGAQPLGIVLNQDGSKTVKFVGVPNRTYVVQSADDAGAGPWFFRTSVAAARTGRFEFRDTESAPIRFYRAIAP